MIEKGWRYLAAASVALLVLGTAGYWWQYSIRPKREEAANEAKKLFQLKSKSVQQIEVVYRPTDRRVVLQCVDPDPKKCALDQQGLWNVVEPVKAKGDGNSVSGLLTALAGLTISETVHLDEETAEKRVQLLKDYELESERRPTGSKVELTFQDGSKQILYLGAVHPAGDKQYVIAGTPDQAQQKDPSTVLMIGAYVKTSLDRDVTFWRDKKIVSFTVFDAEKFELRSHKGDVQGTKQDGHWSVRAGSSVEKFPGDFEAIESLLSAMTGLQATQFAASDVLAPLKQTLSLDVTTKDQKRYRIKLFEDVKAKKAFVTTEHAQAEPGAVFEVGTFVKERLEKAPKDLRLAKLLTSVERYSIQSMEFQADLVGSSGKKSLVFENKESKWIVTADGKSDETLAPKATELLDALSGNRIKDFLQESQLSAEAKAASKKTLSLQLKGNTNALQKRFEFWMTSKPTAVYARDMANPRKGEVYKVDDALASKLPWGATFPSPVKP
jgi:hypothetical protein